MSVYPSGVTNPTLLDWANATDPNGALVQFAEVLNQTNQILDDMTWTEGNLATGHRFAVRTGLPEPTWRRMYQGVQPTKGTRVQVSVSTGMMEDYAEVDKALADLNGNSATFRMQEDNGHIEGMSQKMAQYLFTGDETLEPEAITGFNPHFNSFSAGTADQLINGGGTGSDNGSIYLVGWAPTTVFGIFPKGSKAGLTMTDKGQVTAIAKTADGSADGYYEAYRTHYRWDAGLVVQDWRYVVRICNIDRSLLTADMSTGAKLPDLMFQAMERPPSLEGARFAFYMDRNMLTTLRQQMPNYVKGSTLGYETVGGKRVTDFQGIPIRRVDKLNADEARVV